jgi:hypothetical protein
MTPSSGHVRFAPKSGHRLASLARPVSAKSGHMRCSKKYSFDHLAGVGEHARRNCQAQRLSGLEVDHQHERGRLDKRQIGRAKLGRYHGGLLQAFAWGYL